MLWSYPQCWWVRWKLNTEEAYEWFYRVDVLKWRAMMEESMTEKHFWEHVRGEEDADKQT